MSDLRRLVGKLMCVATRSLVAATVCLVLVPASAGPSQAQGWQTEGEPQGVYAHVDLHFLINEISKAFYEHHELGKYEPSCPPQAPTGHPHFLADLHNHLKSVYHRVLNNSAVSGIAAGIHWCLLEPENGKYYWTWELREFGNYREFPGITRELR